MYHSNARFNRYGGFNKREHIVKFKIRDKTTTPSIIGITKPQPITSCSSSSSSSADQFDLIEKPVIKNPIKSPVIKSPVIKNDTIFDFPDTEETLEVKLMVASGRAIPEHHKKPKKPKKKVSPVNTPRSSSTTTTTNTTIKKLTAQKKKSMNKPVKVTPSRTVPIMQTLTNDLLQNALPLQKVPKQQIHNKLPHYASTVLPNQHPLLAQQNRLIQQQYQQQQDYQYQRNQHQLNLIMQQQQLIQQQQQQQQQQQLLQVQQESIFDIFDFDYNPQVSIKHNSTINDSYGIGTSNPINTIQPNLNYTSNLFTSNTTSLVSLSSLVKDKKPHTPEKKRKRNLVSHLKTARGEIASAPSFDFLSDEEDPMPIRDVPLTLPRSVSPELSYNERMELELKSMTQPEPITSTESKRIPYQPQNKLNVKITFKKPQ